MNCTQMDRLLDAMLDGTLAADDLTAVEAHCEHCAACAEKLKANRQLMRVFAEMAPEMDVPLTAQAAWRSAVKKEERGAGHRRIYRLASGIAAALVVAVGATFALKTPARDNAATVAPEMARANEYVASEAAVIEADGAMEEMEEMDEAEAFDGGADFSGRMTLAAGKAAAPMCEINMTVDDVERVCQCAQDLAQEYEGHIDVQRFDEDGAACANLYIDLPAANAAEFFEAIRRFDLSGVPRDAFRVDGETSILLVLRSK